MRKKNIICKNLNCDTIFGKSGDFSQTPTKKESIDCEKEAQAFLCPLLVTLIPPTRSYLVK